MCERGVAKNLASEGINIDALGLESIDEPLLYDLCPSDPPPPSRLASSLRLTLHLSPDSDGVDQHYGGLGGGHYTVSSPRLSCFRRGP